MSTIDSTELVAKMLRNGGVGYEEDPRVTAIYLYANAFNGAPAYKLVWETAIDNFVEVGCYQGAPIALLKDGEITEDGAEWLKMEKNGDLGLFNYPKGAN